MVPVLFRAETEASSPHRRLGSVEHSSSGVGPVGGGASARLADPMAGPFATIERFLERLFERPAARLFQARLEAIHLQRHLERAMEAQRVVRERQTNVPTHYRVVLSPSDLASFEENRVTLAVQLGEGLHAHARRRGYTLAARPQVELESSTAVATGDVVIEAAPVQPRPERGKTTFSRPEAADPAHARREPAGASPDPGGAPAGGSSGSAGPASGSSEPPSAAPEGTMIFRAAQPDLPSAVLAVHVAGRPVSQVPVSGGKIRVGRSLDNDIVLADDKVSRHHGQIGVRLGMLVYTDLGSTNGSYLNGNPVTEIALGRGDVLQLGGSTLTIEPGN
jgi:hypothetical protein